MFEQINMLIKFIDDKIWGLPLITVILLTGIYLTLRLGFLQIRHLGKALRYMVKNEDGGDGEVSSFGALCTALSATIGTGNIVGVATAIAARPGSLILDGGCGAVWNGDEICRRSSGYFIPYH